MSTILNALQKSQSEQTNTQLVPPKVSDKLRAWKIAISIALLIIIGLLSALLYLLVNPPQNVTPLQTSITEIRQTPDKGLIKVSFETQPLPPVITSKPLPKVIKVIAPTKTIEITKPISQEIATETQEIATTTQKEVLTNDEQVTSEELKKRFALALLLTEMEEHNTTDVIPETIETETYDDGSDINEMSSNFQNKVPIIRYDSHMYSSIPTDRWIRINGEKLAEGSFDSSGQLELIEIQPQRSMFRFQRQSFSLESLTDWKGY